MNEINIVNIDYEYIGEINRIFTLNENRGVVTNYFDYAWEICEALSKSKPIMIDSDILKYEIENYKIQREDFFLLTLILEFLFQIINHIRKKKVKNSIVIIMF